MNCIKRNIMNTIILTCLTTALTGFVAVTNPSTSKLVPTNETNAGICLTLAGPDLSQVQPSSIESEVESTGVMDSETPSLFADINKEWLARCVYSENGNQGFECQVKTAKVILNRVLDEKFPNTVEDVVSSPGQFTVYSNGCMWSKEPTEETYAAIEQAIAEIEADPEGDKILYFNNAPFTGGWCTFAYQVGQAFFYYRKGEL